MKGWSFFKGEEEKNKIPTIMDNTKPLRKRLTAIQNVLKSFEKTQDSPPYSEKEWEFFNENGQAVESIALATLSNMDPNKSKGKSAIWEDVTSCMFVLVEQVKYRFLHYPDQLLEVARVCLYENNYWDIRDLGFDLLLHILNVDPDSRPAQELLLAAIDLNVFLSSLTGTQSLTFPDHSALSSAPTQPWMFMVQEWLKKQRSRTQLPELQVIKKPSQNGMNLKIKECLLLVNRVFEFTNSSDLPPTPENRKAHFRRWYQLLRKTLLFLFYPKLSQPVDYLRADMGLQEECHPLLQLFVILWIQHCIEDEVLRDSLISCAEEYVFVMDVLGKSLHFEDVSYLIYIKNAKNVMKIYENWLQPKLLPSIAAANYGAHVRVMLEHIVHLFMFVRAVNSAKIRLIKRVNDVLSHFRGICPQEAWPVLVSGTLAIAQKLLESVSTQQISLEIIDPTAKNILEMLKVGYKFTDIPWHEFKRILRVWADNSEFIVATWKDLLLELTETQKPNFDAEYTNFLYLLGDPLKLKEQSQYAWVTSWRAVLQSIFQPAYQAPSSNLLFKMFMPTLSKIVRESKFERCACEALESLMDLLTLTRTALPPYEFYLLHLARLLVVNLPRLSSTGLKRGDIILAYAGMHALAPTLLKQAISQSSDGIRVAFACLCFSNHYKNCKLASLESDITSYAQLKPLVHQVLKNASADPIVAPLALYGITVSVMDEVLVDSGLADQLVIDVLIPSLSRSDPTIHAALISLNFLAPILPHLAGIVLSAMLSCLIDTSQRRESNGKEGIILEVLDALTYWCMSSSILADDLKLCQNLFNVLSGLQIGQWKTNAVARTVEVLTSFYCFYYQNFPLKGQPSAITHSIISDTEFGKKVDGSEADFLHFALGANAIITVPLSTEPGKAIIRNQFGRFCWNATHFRVMPTGPESSDFELLEKLRNVILGYTLSFECDSQPLPLEDHNFIPDLLQYVKATYPECPSLDSPKTQDYQNTLQQMEDFDDFEEKYRGVPQVPVEQKSWFCTTRAFFGQFGLLSRMSLLESGDKLDRALGILDKMKSRELVKVGVVYVANGQVNEKEILANDFGSPAFQDFVKTLGKVVHVDKHEGNLGGLDTSGSNGKQTIVWSDWKHDVVFHVVPMMPTDYKDDQQINKKRHVGNDHVHIVWSEHTRDYRADTITSNFNSVHIVVYPLSSQLYRVQILKKLQDINFGPVQDEMVLSKQLLGPLLRATAISANDAVRRVKYENIEPMVQSRKKQIEEIVSRYRAVSVHKEDVFAAMF